MNILSTIVRYAVGGLFIFSGLIKINDPVGTAIKMEEYFEVFSADISIIFHGLVPFALPIAIFLCVLEVVLGLALILNHRSNISLIVLLVLIIFFTFLTFYSAYFNKVTDCGCFGDAIKLTPWQSFYKDIILTVMSVFLLIFSMKPQSDKSKKVSDYILIGFTVLNIGLAVYAVRHLPYIDFRAYKVGNHIPTEMKSSAEFIYEYIMEKDGEVYKFDSYPADKAYKYKELKLVNPEAQPKITDYAVWNDEGDFTESTFVGNKLFIILYDVSKSDKDKFSEINSLAETLKSTVEVIALTASDSDTFSSFSQEVSLKVPFYYTDATVLKTITRSNPGLWLMKDGLVKGKWHYNDIPSAYDVQELLR